MITPFQALLLLFVAAAMFYFIVIIRRSAVQRLFVVAFFGVIALAVIFPQATTVIANFVGIGRGVDFVLYLAVFFLIVSLFQLQLRMAQHDLRLTLVVRALARQAPLQSTPASPPTEKA